MMQVKKKQTNNIFLWYHLFYIFIPTHSKKSHESPPYTQYHFPNQTTVFSHAHPSSSSNKQLIITTTN
jgi:hypothetical protein